MSRKLYSAVLLVGVCLLAACDLSSPQMPVASAPVPGPVVPVGQPETRDLGPTTETVWNCGSGGGTVVKHPSMSVVTTHAVEWQVGGTVGVGVKIGEGVIPGGVDLSASLEGRYVSRFEQGIQQGTGWDLPAEPNTIMVYTLMWREVWQPGYVDVRLADQSVVRVNVRYRTGVQSEIVGKQKQTCDGEQTPPARPGTQPTSVVSVPTATAPLAAVECREEQFGPWGYQDELSIKIFPRSAHYVVSLWWKGRLTFTESVAVRRVNAPSGSGDTEIIFVVPPAIEEIRFRNPAGGISWRLCNRSLAQAQADADAHGNRLNSSRPDVQYWRINLPDGLSDPGVRQLVSCVIPNMQSLPECR